MRRTLIIVLLLLITALPAAALSDAKSASAAEPAAAQPFAAEAGATTAIKGYLERMKISFQSAVKDGYPIIDFSEKMPNATHHVRIVIDAKRGLIYVFLNRYLVLPNENPNRDAVLRELMKKNWDLNIGKFEWDPSDGEIRFSYCFTTENGVGFEAFEAIVTTLLTTGDKFWPELRKLTGIGKGD